MDTLTHTAIGVCTGQLIAGKQLGKKAMLFGVIANNLPDIDVLANIWASNTKALLAHRGITHSIFMAVVLTFLLAWLCKRFYKKKDVSYKKWLLIWGSGLVLHLFTDALTSYGTGWFEPFFHSRISFNTIFILDPLFAVPLWITGIALLIFKTSSTKSFTWAKAGLSVAFIYLSFTIINKIHIDAVVENTLKEQKISHNDFLATPTPLNNFLWYIVARNEKDLYVGYYSLFDKDRAISFSTFHKNDSLLLLPCDTASVNDLIRFSQNYYCFNLKNDTVVFSDMRFGQIGGWYKPDAPFVFNFKLATNCKNNTALQKGRFEGFNSETTIQLFRRIRGKK